MKIVVKTVYENIEAHDLYDWVDRVFKKSWFGKTSTMIIEEMKIEFLNGEKVAATTYDPDSNASATTTWELLK